jgi:hypothetical protein
MKSFKQFLENYDVYIDTPQGWSDGAKSGMTVLVHAPETVSQDTKPSSSKTKKKTKKMKVV